MKVTFLGTGTSMGVPVAGGFGFDHLAYDPRNERSRCSVWVNSQSTSILIDAGPEFRIQSIRAGIKNIDLVLLTHEHMDHITGLEDLRAYNYVQKNSIPVYGTKTCVQAVRGRFDYMFGDNKYPGSTSIELKEAGNKAFHFNDVTITPIPCFHGDLQILGYRINDLCYLSDVKEIPESSMNLLSGSKTLIISGLRWEPEHPTHLTIPQAVDIIEQIKPDNGYLIHMNSYVDHQETNNRLPDYIKLAFDQQVIEVS